MQLSKIAYASLVAFGVSCSVASAGVGQWTPIGPGGGPIGFIKYDPASAARYTGGGEFALGSNDSLFTSTDGVNWFPISPLDVGWVFSFTIAGPTIYLGADKALYKSTDRGSSWAALPLRQVKDLIASGDSLVAIAGSGIFSSTDGGATWSGGSGGVPPSPLFFAAGSGTGETLLGTLGGPYRGSFTGGWIPSNTGMENAVLFSMDTRGAGKVYAGTANGVYKSSDGGMNWSPLGLSFAFSVQVDSSQGIKAGASPGFYESTDDGNHWTSVSTGLPAMSIYAIAPNGSPIGGSKGGLFQRSGNTWSPISNNVKHTSVTDIVFGGGRMHVASEQDGLFYTSDSGVHWGHPSFSRAIKIARDPVNGALYAIEDRLVYKSTDFGSTWQLISQFPLTAPLSTDFISIVVSSSQRIYIGSFQTGVYVSADGGFSWSQSTNGLPRHPLSSNEIDRIDSMAVIGSTDPSLETVFAGTRSGVYRKTGGGSWSFSGSGLGPGVINSLQIDPTNSAKMYAGLSPNGLFKSINGGFSWTTVNFSQFIDGIKSVAIDPTNTSKIYVARSDGAIFRSSNEGATWNPVPDGGLTNRSVVSLAVDPSDPSTIYAGTLGGGVFALTQRAPRTAFYTLSPCRIIDTRLAQGPYDGPGLKAGAARRFDLAGQCGVPANAVAVSANLTLISQGQAGYLQTYTFGTTNPTTSVLNFNANQIRTNNAILQVGRDGRGSIVVQPSLPEGLVHLIIDINGYFTERP